jgi:hypothetical protein
MCEMMVNSSIADPQKMGNLFRRMFVSHEKEHLAHLVGLCSNKDLEVVHFFEDMLDGGAGLPGKVRQRNLAANVALASLEEAAIGRAYDVVGRGREIGEHVLDRVEKTDFPGCAEQAEQGVLDTFLGVIKGTKATVELPTDDLEEQRPGEIGDFVERLTIAGAGAEHKGLELIGVHDPAPDGEGANGTRERIFANELGEPDGRRKGT